MKLNHRRYQDDTMTNLYRKHQENLQRILWGDKMIWGKSYAFLFLVHKVMLF